VVATSTFWRNAWRYGDRTYRHSFWDTGTILANLLAVAQAHGVPASFVAGFADGEVNHLLGVDGIGEAAIALVPLGVGNVATSIPPAEAIDPPTVPVSAREVRFPLIEQAHQASSLSDASAVRAWREAGALGAAMSGDGDFAPTALTRPAPLSLDPVGPEHPDHDSMDPIDVVIAHRGSARRFDARPIPLDALQFMLRAAVRPVTADTDSSLLDMFVLVERVTGLEPGLYRLADDQRSLALLESGTLGEAGERATVSNGIAGAAAANVFVVCDLAEVQRRYGDRGYRAAQLHAGIRGGLLYLAAHALGVAATGLTFYDDLVVSLLRSTARAPGVLFMTAVGRPGSRS
jgi:SagB-type dehydrogenase family enzyme